jgi:hypothetical protein
VWTGYPPDCPPETAKTPQGDVFRLIAGDSCVVGDLRPGRQFGGKLKCQSLGLSVYTTLSDVQAAKAGNPETFGKHHIVKANGSSLPGKLGPTPSRMTTGHHTWWLPPGTELPALAALFVIAE